MAETSPTKSISPKKKRQSEMILTLLRNYFTSGKHGQEGDNASMKVKGKKDPLIPAHNDRNQGGESTIRPVKSQLAVGLFEMMDVHSESRRDLQMDYRSNAGTNRKSINWNDSHVDGKLPNSLIRMQSINIQAAKYKQLTKFMGESNTSVKADTERHDRPIDGEEKENMQSTNFNSR